jgi:hypothetical protein
LQAVSQNVFAVGALLLHEEKRANEAAIKIKYFMVVDLTTKIGGMYGVTKCNVPVK